MAAGHEKTFRRNSENKIVKYVENVFQNVKSNIKIKALNDSNRTTCGQKSGDGKGALLFDSLKS